MTLQFFGQPEGYVTPSAVEGSYDYVYQYVDHLGNVRLSYTDKNQNTANGVDLEIVEENNYYPFGLKHKGYNSTMSTEGNGAAQRWKFGGKEYMEDMDLDWYDVSARNYDPALGRWMNIDPLADQMRRHSPYNYAFDNPVFYIDADGMSPAASNGYQDLSAEEVDAFGIQTSVGVLSGTDTKTGKSVTFYASDFKDVKLADSGGSKGKDSFVSQFKRTSKGVYHNKRDNIYLTFNNPKELKNQDYFKVTGEISLGPQTKDGSTLFG